MRKLLPRRLDPVAAILLVIILTTLFLILGSDPAHATNCANSDCNGAVVSSSGSLSVNIEGRKATYAAAAAPAVVASATDICILPGSATKLIRVTKIVLSGMATTGITIPVGVILRTSANSGGTSTATTSTPYDSNSAAASAIPLSYTANPTIGSGVPLVLFSEMFPISTSPPNQPTTLVFGVENSSAVVLRGVAQGLAINLGGATIVGGVFSCSYEWTEE